MRAGGKVYLTGKAQRLDGIGQPEVDRVFFYLRVPTHPVAGLWNQRREWS